MLSGRGRKIKGEIERLLSCTCDRDECPRCNPEDDEAEIIFDMQRSFEDRRISLIVLRDIKRHRPSGRVLEFKKPAGRVIGFYRR